MATEFKKRSDYSNITVVADETRIDLRQRYGVTVSVVNTATKVGTITVQLTSFGHSFAGRVKVDVGWIATTGAATTGAVPVATNVASIGSYTNGQALAIKTANCFYEVEPSAAGLITIPVTLTADSAGMLARVWVNGGECYESEIVAITTVA